MNGSKNAGFAAVALLLTTLGAPAEERGKIAASWVGDIDRALDLLERVLPRAGHELKHGWIKYDSDLDPLRDHPRYQKILELIG